MTFQSQYLLLCLYLVSQGKSFKTEETTVSGQHTVVELTM